MRVKTEVIDEGVQDLLRNLTDGGIERAIDDSVADLTVNAANTMSARAPVDTGHLRESLTAARSVVRKGIGEFHIKNNTPYTIRQNFEHKTMSGFVSTPFYQTSLKFSDAVAEAIMEAIG